MNNNSFLRVYFFNIKQKCLPDFLLLCLHNQFYVIIFHLIVPKNKIGLITCYIYKSKNGWINQDSSDLTGKKLLLIYLT